MRTKLCTLLSALALTFCSTTYAQDAKPQTKTLTIGDRAPTIDIEHWIKGEKVERFENGKIYIVEFWATWCGPCRVSMPHLSELQKRYKPYDVTFIGVSDEPLDVVSKWLDTVEKESQKKWIDIIDYTLATDPDKSVKTDYFTAAGQRGIPSAFIVGRDAHIEWIGNPHPLAKDGFDQALEAIVKGEWDREAYKIQRERKAEAERASAEARRQLNEAIGAGDWKKVVAITDSMLSADPKDRGAAMLKFTTMAGPMGESAKAYEFLKSHLHAHFWDDAMVLNDFAWAILDDERIKEKDLTYAIGLAMRAVKLSEEKEPAILDTYARCWYERGNLVEAVKWQTAAVKLAGDSDMAKSIRETLEKYQRELEAQQP